MDKYLRFILIIRRISQAASIILILSLAICASADVVTIRQNLDKYWLYRNKQQTEFLVPGVGQGYSMPAAWRNPDTHIIKWADSTIDLGWRIGELATEHYMLSHPEIFPGYASGGGDLNQVRNDLYYALSAINRVDATAEACFSPTATDTPGFFIRDDVPATFYSHFPGMTTAWSDYANTTTPTDKEMSQDQVIHVLLGLSLVKKLIPADLVINGMNLRQSAITRGTNIVDWVHQHGWIIKNPVTNTDVIRGEDARAFSTGFNKTVVYLTDGATDFGSLYSWIWSTLSSPTNPAYDNRNNLHMAMSLAATGNGWGDSTLDSLMSLSAAHDWYAYVLLYATLWDPIPQTRSTWLGHQQMFNGLVQTMLNSAPATATPHHPLSPSENNTGWCGSRRFIVTRDAQNNGEGEYSVGECYNGLDYSLLHNLYYIVTPSLWQDPSPPGQAVNPNPANGATGVSISTSSLSWSAGGGATSHDVYFGTSNPPAFKQNQTETTYNPGALSGSTTYYWRIDEKGVTGTTTGTVWSFTTVAPPDTTPPGPVTSLTSTMNTMQINLIWTNPTVSDFAGTRIVFKTTGYPTSPTDGTLLYNGTGTSCVHTGISTGTTYYYSAYAYDEVPNYSTATTKNVLRPGFFAYADSFSYPNNNLNGNIGWSGSATNQIQIENSTVKINGGATGYEAIRPVSCGDPGSGFIWVTIKAKAGTGISTLWSLYIDDAAGNNLARWYGSGTTARGRIGGTSDVTSTWNLTSNWDELSVKISPSANTSEFFVNGVSIGTLSHASQGAGDTIGRLRFERIDNADTLGNYVYLDDLTIGPTDTAPPASVSNLTATKGDAQIILSWKNPPTSDFLGAIIRYKTTGYPTSPTDGILLVNKPNLPGSTDSYIHTCLTNGTTYYYRVYTYDEIPNYSSGPSISAIPADSQAPGSVTSFAVIVGNQLNNLMWTNPTDSDFAGTTILFKTTGYPTNSTDGTLVYSGTGTSTTHTGLTNNTIYYYSAFASDEVPNYSTKADANGMPIYFDPLQAKLLANNSLLTLTSGVVSTSFTDKFYVQCIDKPVGIRVDKPNHGLSIGQTVGIKGTALTDPANSEKYISAIWAQANGTEPISPIAMNAASIGGAAWNYIGASGAGQQGLTNGYGPNNIGLLVRIWGKITQRDTTNLQYFYIDNGSGQKDGTKTAGVDNIGIRVLANPNSYSTGNYVTITGVVSIFNNNGLKPHLLPQAGGILLIAP